jgi:hypothetical protein
MRETMHDTQHTAVENITQHELDIIKSEMHERSRRAGTIEFVGTLGGETPSEYWTGPISLQQRQETGEVSTDELRESLDYLSLCYVLTQKSAAQACIDPRLLEGYDDNDPALFASKLGPKSPGGTAIDGVADRIVCIAAGEQQPERETFSIQDDISTMAEAAGKTGYKAGDHVAANCAPGKCGCGAVDGIVKHCETIVLPALPEVKAITKSLLGDAYSEETFNEVSDSVQDLLSVKENYFLASEQIIAELLAHNPEAAPVFVGTHNEVAVILNMVAGETLHKDHYATRTDGKIMAFNYDVWHTLEMAEARYPEDAVRQNRFVHARIALAVTALMDLTDGTLLVGVRTASVTEQLA